MVSLFFQYFANNYHDSHYQEHWQLLTEIEELTAQLLEQGLKPLGIECTPHNSEMEQKGSLTLKMANFNLARSHKNHGRLGRTLSNPLSATI